VYPVPPTMPILIMALSDPGVDAAIDTRCYVKRANARRNYNKNHLLVNHLRNLSKIVLECFPHIQVKFLASRTPAVSNGGHETGLIPRMELKWE
jgi:hypothetical protein